MGTIITVLYHGGKKKEPSYFGNIFYSQIMTDTDQQQLYTNATTVVNWMESEVPSAHAIRTIGIILVSMFSAE
jgi:hypothetical protein